MGRHRDMLDTIEVNDVFPEIPEFFKINNTQANLHRKETLDLSKVSNFHLNKTILSLKNIFQNSTVYNSTVDEEAKLLNETKIAITNNFRRSALTDTRRGDLPFFRYEIGWSEASKFVMRQKILDCMLTLIYMARHHVVTMAKQQINAPHDDAFRLAYLFTKLVILHDRMISVYNTMAVKVYSLVWERQWDRAFYYLMLHQKAMKLHFQADFYFWLIAKIQHKFALMNQIYLTTPTTRKPTTIALTTNATTTNTTTLTTSKPR